MMRTVIYLLVLTVFTATYACADAEFYLSARADGKDGAGTAVDPFNAGSQQQFDTLFAGFGPNTVIHLGPGTYHTQGKARFSVQAGWKIRGAGYEVTRIVQDRTGKIGCTVFAGRADGVEIEDLSVDCGFQNQQLVNGKIKANASAIGIGGSHIAVRRCLFKNYGSPYDQDTGENFAVFIGSPDPANGENLVVEDCIFAGMSPLLAGGQSVLTIAGGPPANNLTAGNWARGTIARRNYFTGYHYGCHGITMSGSQGGVIEDNVFEHFMGACVYQDTWPMRDIVVQNNIMSDVNQGIRLAGDWLDMNDFQIRNNIILVNDGYDLKSIVNGVATTAIPHSLVVGNRIRFHQLHVTSGTGFASDSATVTSVPDRTSFTYSLTPGGKSDSMDNATGGFVQALDYQGCMCPAPEALVVFTGGGKEPHPPTNFIIERNIIKPYSSDDTCRVPSSGISVCGLRRSQIVDNMVADSGNHADLVVTSPKGFTSTIVCRDNYHPDGTPLLPRDGKREIIPSGLLDLPLDAGKGITLTPANGRVRIDLDINAHGVGANRMSRQVDATGPAHDHLFPGKPGDYAMQGDNLYLYMGDGTAHLWKRLLMGDY